VHATTGDYLAKNGGDLSTKVVSGPTILAGEKMPEMIVDGMTYKYAKMNYPEAINAIFASRRQVRGFAEGKYPGESLNNTKDTQALERLYDILERTEKEGLSVSYNKLGDSVSEVSNLENRM
jgi:hypothetical protein